MSSNDAEQPQPGQAQDDQSQEEQPQEEGGVSLPSKNDLKQMSEEERKKGAEQASKAAASVGTMIDSLKSKAAVLTDPKEREKKLAEIYDREMEKRGLSKKARILETGTFQGAVTGAGFGVATGAGLGTVVGTLVGGVASIPTTAVGGLVGAGTGAIHGPWIKLKRKGDDGEEREETVQVPQEDIDRGAVQIDDKTGQVTDAEPGVLENAPRTDQESSSGSGHEPTNADESAKRKPPKLEVRSNKQDHEEAESTGGAQARSSDGSDTQPKRKPPKLEVRSGKTD